MRHYVRLHGGVYRLVQLTDLCLSRGIRFMIPIHRHTRYRTVLFCLALSLPALGTGCASMSRWVSGGWFADYEPAEAQVHKTGRELLIYYKDNRPGVTDHTADALQVDGVKQRIHKYVRCHLFKDYEPHRRYVGQYGVERAPALIVVHNDGTYHSRTGLMSAADIAEFLDQAQPPGSKAVPNAYLPREAAYHWHDSPGSAYAAAEQTEQPILFVFHRWLSGDWRKMEKLLDRAEAYSRFAGMVHCRLSSLDSVAREAAANFGIANWPALVIADRDGTYSVLELPTSFEQIVRFVDGRRTGGGGAGELSASADAEP
jgi:hypothetical protein